VKSIWAGTDILVLTLIKMTPEVLSRVW